MAKLTIRNEQIIKIYNNGSSLKDITSIFRITHQRIYQILQSNPDLVDRKKAREVKLAKRRENRALVKSANSLKHKGVCVVCKKEFYSPTATKKYCSNRCVANRNGVLYSRPEGENATTYQRNRRKAYYHQSDKYKDLVKYHNKKQAEKYPEKIQARAKLNYALSLNKIVKPDICSVCNFSTKHKDVARIEAHHPDYTKPFEVVWLCTKCHNKTHRNNHI